MFHNDQVDPQDENSEESFHPAGEQRTEPDVFQSYFAQYPDLEVAGITEDAASESLDAAVSSVIPDIVLMGTKSVGPAAVEKMRKVRAAKPEAAIVLLADRYEPEGFEALRRFSLEASAGYAYLSADMLEKRDQLVDAMSMAAAGRIIIDREVMDGLLAPAGGKGTLFSSLEPWERDVLKLLVSGFPDDTGTEES